MSTATPHAQQPQGQVACPACGSKRTVDGRIMAFGAHAGNASRFFPNGLKLLTLRRGLLLRDRPRMDACADCGLVWSHVDAQALREMLESQGTRETKARMAKKA